MNDSEKTTEAEQKKPGDLTDSIARMTACLEDVIANAKAALTLSKDMDRDDMKWMTLSKAVFDVHNRLRMGWQKLVDPAAGTGGGAFFTKKEILDFVMANPPIGDVKDAATSLDPSAPEMVRGGAAEDGRRLPMSRPEAVNILCRMATMRKVNVKGVIALQMGVRSLLKRHFDRQRNWALRREQSANAAQQETPSHD